MGKRKSHEYDIEPTAKPRMTRSDKWKKRPIVMNYRAFKDECRTKGVQLPDGCKVTFFIAIPKSWPKRKKKEMHLTPHLQTPDLDNLLKGLWDAIYEDDSHMWQCDAQKLWRETAGIKVEWYD